MISKGCVYYLVGVWDVTSNVPSLELVFIVNAFVDVFLDELPNVPTERKINFVIDLLLNIQAISTPLYCMTPGGLIELKKKLKDLLDKVFIRLSRSPWGSHVFFIKKKNGSLQMCINHWQLSKITINNKFHFQELRIYLIDCKELDTSPTFISSSVIIN